MLTSKDIDHSGAPTIAFIRQHLEDHEKGEFLDEATSDYPCLIQKIRLINKENVKLRQECAEFKKDNSKLAEDKKAFLSQLGTAAHKFRASGETT